MADWSEIGEDITDLFIERLPGIQDFLRFSYVCKLWRSVAMQRKQRQGFCSSIPLAPWLMLTEEEEDEHNRSFFRTKPEKTISFPLPQAQRSRCWGSPYGWIITVDLDLNINLLHPLSQTQMSLPPVPNLMLQSKLEPQLLSSFKVPVTPAKICWGFLWKFCLLSTPTPPSHNCIVTAVFGASNELAFVRPGDESWTFVESSIGSRDIIPFKGNYYGLHHSGMVRLYQLDDDVPKAIDIADPPEDAMPYDKFYLVEMLEQLHIVIRLFSIDDPTHTVLAAHCKTTGFGVFKFDFSAREWEELEDLGDHAIFVGNNTSFAISTTTQPHFKRNCIYFTDDDGVYYKSNYADMGVYDYEEQTIEPIFSEDVSSDIYRPLFFMPTL